MTIQRVSIGKADSTMNTLAMKFLEHCRARWKELRVIFIHFRLRPRTRRSPMPSKIIQKQDPMSHNVAKCPTSAARLKIKCPKVGHLAAEGPEPVVFRSVASVSS